MWRTMTNTLRIASGCESESENERYQCSLPWFPDYSRPLGAVYRLFIELKQRYFALRRNWFDPAFRNYINFKILSCIVFRTADE